MLRDLGVLTGRHDRTNGPALLGTEGIEDLAFIIGPIGAQPVHGLLDLPQQWGSLRGVILARGRQGLGDHLARFSLEARMRFALGATLGPAVLTDPPFACVIPFQSRAVGHQRPRFVGRLYGPIHLQSLGTTRPRRIVRRRQLQAPHRAQRQDNAFGLPQAQAQQRAKRQRRLKSRIRVDCI